MKKTITYLVVLLFTFNVAHSQVINTIFPPSLASHTAVQSGNWNDSAVWNNSTIPDDGAIVHIPNGIEVTYTRTGPRDIFIIRVDGTFNVNQPDPTKTTRLRFDTLITSPTSNLNIISNTTGMGNVIVDISPFDIMGSPLRSSWTTAQQNHFIDHSTVTQYNYTVTGDDRYNTLAQANSSSNPLTVTQTAIGPWPDGIGVLGRYTWDATQLTIGVVTMGNVNIDGLEKTNMVKLGADASSGTNILQVENTPLNWKDNDDIIVTSGGNVSTSNNGEDQVKINGNVTTNTINLTSNLSKNHEGRNAPNLGLNLHCYVGNLTRSIEFKSPSTANMDERGHFMAMNMGNNPNVSIKNASFLRMGRTDKSRPTDDFYWNNWLEPGAPTSKISALGLECAEMAKAPNDRITNSRGRYSIHLHRLGASGTSNQAVVTGNVVWDNPGWAITHHDSNANISNNVVYLVTGAGIVSENGNEIGIWEHNLVTNVQSGYNGDLYESSLYFDDLLFSGDGFGMKGRGVLCKDNVITNTVVGVRVFNINNSISNLVRMNADALANSRPGYNVEQFPLNRNGYSKYGDGVLPIEVSLIMENTTIIDSNQGMKSIERDMGVNHESRSIFDVFIAWGIKTGIAITYQADYSYKDVFISGDGSPKTLGVDLFKHSHNQTFENIYLTDLVSGIQISKLTLNNNQASTTEGPKLRNNGFTPWYFIDLDYSVNVNELYRLEIDNENVDPTYIYEQCTDNTIILPNSAFSNRPTTFTQLTESIIDYTSTGETALRFKVDGIITDDLGSYKMGIEQSPAQENLRFDYPERIYQFATTAKFKEFLNSNGGVYKDEANGDQLYFILNENLPDRKNFDYTTFPIRIKILNAPNEAPFNNPSVESPTQLIPKNQIISRMATATQSSTRPNITYNDNYSVEGAKPVNFIASNAVDGNTNGRINANYYQRNFIPFVGSQSQTDIELNPWFELDFGEDKMIEYIDLWNTVDQPVNGSEEETPTAGFNNFYVLISDIPFTSMSAQNLSTWISESDYSFLYNSGNTRKVSLNDLGVVGRYMRIVSNKTNMTRLKFAEIEVIGSKSLGTLSNDSVEAKNFMQVYPNPFNNTVKINLGKTYQNVSFTVTNTLGQTVLNVSNRQLSKTDLNITGSSGIYFLTIKADHVTKVVKLIKR